MPIVKPWAQALHIKQDEYQAWIHQLSPGDDITFWALETGKLRLAEYFSWAKEHYGLSVVEENYFHLAPNRALWKKIASVANWSPGLLPLEEWDGVIFVACVEPRADIQWSFPVQYVLASPRALKALWQEFCSQEKTSAGLPPVPKEMPPPQPEDVPDAPAGLTATGINTGFEGPHGLNLQAANAPSILQVPEGMSSAFTNSVAAVDLSKLVPQEPATPKTHEVFFQDEIPTGVFPNPLAASSLPDSPAAEPAQLPNQDVLPPTPAPTVARSAPPVTSIAAAPGFFVEEAKAAASPEAATDEDSAVAWAFAQLHAFYDKSMILVYEGTTNIKPWKAEKGWPAKDGSSFTTALDATKPGFFRITKRTGMPYHGPIVAAEVNKQFLDHWNKNEEPKVVTACAITLHGQPFGQLISVGPEKAETTEALQHCEKIVHRLCTALEKYHKKAA